jgi:hypothetical protein
MKKSLISQVGLSVTSMALARDVPCAGWLFQSRFSHAIWGKKLFANTKPASAKSF